MKRRRGGKRLRKSAAQMAVQKWTAIALCAALALSLIGNAVAPIAFAAEEPAGLCPHHERHDDSCGWQAAMEGTPCAHVHDGNCGYIAPEEGTPCAHEHDETCGYAEGTEEIPCDMECAEVDEDGNLLHDLACAYTPAKEGTPCAHQHDETCGYSAPVEGVPCAHVHDDACGLVEEAEEHPCAFLCEWCVTAWEWNDEAGALVWNADAGTWGLGMSGVSREQPVTREILEELLPRTVTVQTAAGPKTADVTWDLGVISEEGAWEGDYTLTAALPGEYVLTGGVPALEALLELGGGEAMAVDKALNVCRFIPRTGTSVYQDTDGMWTIDIRLPAGLSPQELAERVKQILPEKVRGYGYTTSNVDGFEYEGKDPNPPTGAPSHAGRLSLDWEPLPTIQYGENKLTPKGKSTLTWEINQGVGSTSGPLQLKAVIQFLDLNPHIVTPAAPQNVKVNLFDYWVEDYGKNPTTPQGDILGKSDWHFRPDADGTGKPIGGVTNTPFSTVKDWNKGINEKHLLLFGDGLIHAGLWNKGGGESTQYGNAYAGMEGIVKKVLNNGYPEINLDAAKNCLTEGPAYRDYKLVRDYLLAGTEEANLGTNFNGNAYQGTGVQNLSESVLATWGGDLASGTESLQYLFDPNEPNTYKTSYEDVTGLFQLDNDGYYYYNMRENFAEFRQEGDKNHFILYDAPATVRTDGDTSIGNFFPFNKGSEVFTGLNGDKLTSSVACSRNSMNHHLGMTVDVDFRQPVNGMIGSGTKAQPMSFQFSGDDDVWIFIDDVLVLDLGGIHSEIYGTIDFQSGDVCIGRSFKTKGIPEDPKDPANLVTQTTLRQLFKDAGVDVDINAADWKGSTFASNTTHTLKMFYLERGNYDSSIALRFNLQPLLYQNIVKVDQNGNPIPDVEFALYPAVRNNNAGSIPCLYTDDGSVGKDTFYVTPNVGGGPLVTLTTDENGSAVFHTPEGGLFNFADQGDQYYVLRETKAPDGYRAQPIDIALHYDADTSMLSVANRWTTGAYACSVSNIVGPQNLYYAADIDKNGRPTSGSEAVPIQDVVDGLVVAVPLMKQRSTGSWMALYGSNMTGFGSVKASGGIPDWRGFVLRAALEQAGGENYADWYLDWDAENTRLYGKLYDLPGLASRYLLNNPDNGDMQMVYGFFSPTALAALNVTGASAAERYTALQKYVAEKGVDEALKAIGDVTARDIFRLISVDQFTRDFRSLIYIPNERRELRVLKIDQDGKPKQGAGFALYNNPGCTGTPAASGTTDQDGMLVFSPTGSDAEGQAKMVWANSTNSRYYLKETKAPSGYPLNGTVTPVVVGVYGIYADAGTPDNGVSVAADVGCLTQTMRQYAMGNDVDVTLQDLTAFMQVQSSENFQLDGWEDATLEGTKIPRSMNLHFKRNEFVDYGLHDQDGGKNYKPFFVTDTGFIRTRVQQNYAAVSEKQYDPEPPEANMDDLGGIDLTNLFSLLNLVVVTDKITSDTGKLTIGKKVTEASADADYTKFFSFTVELTDENGTPLDGKYDYYFYGEDKAGKVANGDTLLLRHNEALTILGLPAGTRFIVTEAAETGWHTRPQAGSYTGEITADGDFKASFTNSRKEFPKTDGGSLTIQKTVTGSGGDKTKEFAFTVNLTGVGDFTHDGKTYTLPCELPFTLKDGQSVTIEGLPGGTAYVVKESGNEGYTVTKTGASGAIVDGETSTAAFVNHKDGQPPVEPSEVQVTVRKVWVLDDGGQMAPSVTAVLYRNGAPHDAVELNAGNGWAHTWSGLDGKAAWTVGEPVVPDGFTAFVSKGDRLNFTIFNDDIPKTPPEVPDTPKPPVPPVPPNPPVPPIPPSTPKTPSTPTMPSTPTTPSTPSTPDTPSTPATPSTPRTPDTPRIPQTGVNWWPTWLLAAAGVLLILVGIGKKLRVKGKHEA